MFMTNYELVYGKYKSTSDNSSSPAPVAVADTPKEKDKGMETAVTAGKAVIGAQIVAAKFAGIKGKAAAFAAEHKKSNDGTAPVDETSAEFVTETAETESFDELYEKAMSISDDTEEYDETSDEVAYNAESSLNDDNIEKSVAAPAISQAPASTIVPNTAPTAAPQQFNYEEKKSPVVYVMAGIIAILLVGIGILGGMLLMKTKEEKGSNDSNINAVIATSSDSNSTSTAKASYEKGFVLDTYSLEIEVGETKNVLVQHYPDGCNEADVVWTSSDEKIATVDTYGYITGVSKGKCSITLSFKNNPESKAVVEVVVGEKELSQNEKYKNKILASVDNEEYAGKDSHIENAPSDMIFYDIDGSLSYVMLTNPVLYSGPSDTYDEVYRTKASEQFNVVGENDDWYYLMFFSGTGRFTHMSYGYATKMPSVSEQKKSSLSDEELGYMYNMFYITSIRGHIGGGYIEDYDNDGTDEAILSTSNGGYQVVKYKNGELSWSAYPDGSGYSYGQQLPNMKTPFYDWDKIRDRFKELAVDHGFTSNFSVNSTITESVDAYDNKVYSFGNTFIGYVKTSDLFSTLNLRSSPSINSNVITQLPNGTLFHTIGAYDENGNEISFLDSNPSWYLVELNINGTNYSGYVSGDYVHTWDNAI